MSSTANAISGASKSVLIAVISVLVLAFPSLRTFAQAELDRITGTVTDSNGSFVPGVIITVLDIQQGESRSLTTDQAGLIRA